MLERARLEAGDPERCYSDPRETGEAQARTGQGLSEWQGWCPCNLVTYRVFYGNVHLSGFLSFLDGPGVGGCLEERVRDKNEDGSEWWEGEGLKWMEIPIITGANRPGYSPREGPGHIPPQTEQLLSDSRLSPQLGRAGTCPG